MNRYLGNYDFFKKNFCISSVIVAHHAVISLQLVLLLTIMDSIPVLESSIEADLMYDIFCWWHLSDDNSCNNIFISLANEISYYFLICR